MRMVGRLSQEDQVKIVKEADAIYEQIMEVPKEASRL